MDFEEYVLIGVGIVAAGVIEFAVRHTLDLWMRRNSGDDGGEMSDGNGARGITFALIMDKLASLDKRLEDCEQRHNDAEAELEDILERLSACEEAAGVE